MVKAQDKTDEASPDASDQESEGAERRGLVGQVGPLEVDWPKAAGYYGGLSAAFAAGLIEPPLALFIAAVPLFKMLNRPDAPQIQWIAGELLGGASNPVGGSASPVIRVSQKGSETRGGGGGSSLQQVGGFLSALHDLWTDARVVARGRF